MTVAVGFALYNANAFVVDEDFNVAVFVRVECDLRVICHCHRVSASPVEFEIGISVRDGGIFGFDLLDRVLAQFNDPQPDRAIGRCIGLGMIPRPITTLRYITKKVSERSVSQSGYFPKFGDRNEKIY